MASLGDTYMQWSVTDEQFMCQKTWLPSVQSVEDAPISTDQGYIQPEVAEP